MLMVNRLFLWPCSIANCKLPEGNPRPTNFAPGQTSCVFMELQTEEILCWGPKTNGVSNWGPWGGVPGHFQRVVVSCGIHLYFILYVPILSYFASIKPNTISHPQIFPISSRVLRKNITICFFSLGAR